jgi:uncharacterized protein YlxW (UPF0749 family)
MYHIDKKIIMLTTFIILGILLTVQMKSVFNNNSKSASVLFKLESYQKQLDIEKKKIVEIKKTIDQNVKINDTLLRKFSGGEFDKIRNALWNRLYNTKLMAGLSDVKGKGIKIFLNDAPSREIDNPSKLVIHDGDIINIINELKVAQAQAISINGERLISTSEQICAGPTIRINKDRYTVPYEIMAIGDPNKLGYAVENSYWVASMREQGIIVDVTISEEIQISKFSNNIDKLFSGLEVIG